MWLSGGTCWLTSHFKRRGQTLTADNGSLSYPNRFTVTFTRSHFSHFVSCSYFLKVAVLFIRHTCDCTLTETQKYCQNKILKCTIILCAGVARLHSLLCYIWIRKSSCYCGTFRNVSFSNICDDFLTQETTIALPTIKRKPDRKKIHIRDSNSMVAYRRIY